MTTTGTSALGGKADEIGQIADIHAGHRIFANSLAQCQTDSLPLADSVQVQAKTVRLDASAKVTADKGSSFGHFGGW